jgi:dephospho-CoA kinase|tara:strand:+ start:84 stop:767 length:684 start_codon:yes stop_codon:yes gene_type:complete
MKHFNELQEGLQDPNIFKAFFLAGGPGSGKSYVVRYTTGGTGLRVVNSDDVFEKYLKDAGLSLKMPPEEWDENQKQRKRAKKVTATRQANYIAGRIGMVIDGTGKEYDKIREQKANLEALGYDCHMIFVNTSVEVALERNEKRERTVPEDVAILSWKAVQGNIGKFSQLFKGTMVIVDNNKPDQNIEVMTFKEVKRLLKKKVRNTRAKQWIEMEMKNRGIKRKPKGF